MIVCVLRGVVAVCLGDRWWVAWDPYGPVAKSSATTAKGALVRYFRLRESAG